MKTSLLTAALIAVSIGANAQTTTRLSATKANEYAIVYTLPTTCLEVTIEAEITEQKPGEFYKYARKYLNIDNPITKESHSATVLSAMVTERGIPNPEERYAVTFKPGSPVYMLLDSNNVPVAINTSDYEVPEEPVKPIARPAEPTPLQTAAARQVISEEMMQSQSTAKRAELAAQALFAIRQTRSDLISGQAEQMPPDGRSLEMMLANLDAQEQALLAMFVGTTSVHTEVATFSITPDGNIKNKVIARVSALDGIVDASDLSGAPVTLNLDITSQGEMPVNEKGVELPFPKGGLAYCIPGTATVTVSYDGRRLTREELPFAQFGVVYGLAPNSFTDKKAPIFVTFDPATGAILSQGSVN